MFWPGSISISNTFLHALINLCAAAPNICTNILLDCEDHDGFSSFIFDSLKKGKNPIQLLDLPLEQDPSLSDIFSQFIETYFLPLCSKFSYNAHFIQTDSFPLDFSDIPDECDYIFLDFTDSFISYDGIQTTLPINSLIYHIGGILIHNTNTNSYETFSFLPSNQVKWYKDDGYEKLSMDDFSSLFDANSDNFQIIILLYSSFYDIPFKFDKSESKYIKRNYSQKKVFNTFEKDQSISLENNIHVGEEYSLHDLRLKIDNISKNENRSLYSVHVRPYFVYKCRNCEAIVRGLNANDIITISKVQNHTCEEQGYRPNKSRRQEDAAHIILHDTVKQTLNDWVIRNGGFPYPLSTFHQMIEQNSNSLHEEQWKQIPSLINVFANQNRSNVLIDYANSDNNEIVRFFILPQEAILFINSDIFIGLVVIDGTFLKFYIIGTLIILTTYSGTHEIIPIGWGFCRTENSIDLIPFLQLLKNNIQPEKADIIIKAFMSDQGGAIMRAIDMVFPTSIKRNCLLHKKSRCDPDTRALLTDITRHSYNPNDVLDYIDEFIQNHHLSHEEAVKKSNDMKKYSRFFTPAPTQGVLTNGAAETINSVIKGNKKDGIIDYTKILYFRLRNVLLDMPSKCNENYTTYLSEKIAEYSIASSKSEIIDVDYYGHYAIVKEKIEDRIYSFTVTNENGTLNCSCNKDKEYLFGCIHIYYSCKKTEFGDFESTIHNGYKKKNIENFIRTIPRPVCLDFLRTDQKIIPFTRNKRKYGRKRHVDAIDLLKKHTPTPTDFFFI